MGTTTTYKSENRGRDGSKSRPKTPVTGNTFVDNLQLGVGTGLACGAAYGLTKCLTVKCTEGTPHCGSDRSSKKKTTVGQDRAKQPSSTPTGLIVTLIVVVTLAIIGVLLCWMCSE